MMTSNSRYVGGLGDLQPHGPVMLGWMLGQFLARGQAGLQVIIIIIIIIFITVIITLSRPVRGAGRPL